MGGAVWTPALQQKTRSPSNSSTPATTMRSTSATAPHGPPAPPPTPHSPTRARASPAAPPSPPTPRVFRRASTRATGSTTSCSNPRAKARGAVATCSSCTSQLPGNRPRSRSPAFTTTPSCRWKTVGCSKRGTLPVTSSHGIVTASPPALRTNACSLGRRFLGIWPLFGYPANTSGQGPVWMPAALVEALPRAVRNTVRR